MFFGASGCFYSPDCCSHVESAQDPLSFSTQVTLDLFALGAVQFWVPRWNAFAGLPVDRCPAHCDKTPAGHDESARPFVKTSTRSMFFGISGKRWRSIEAAMSAPTHISTIFGRASEGTQFVLPELRYD
jgi:hypothetical protein